MSIINREGIDRFKPLLADYLQKYHYIDNLKEPFKCLNPNHIDNHPSMFYTSKYNICKCFSCGISYDIYDLIGIDYGLETFKEQLEKASNLYPSIANIEFKKFDIIESNYKVFDFSNYFKKCYKDINNTDYLDKRMIDKKLVNKYRIGYDKSRDMIIFPINKNSYFARSISNNSKIKSKGISYLWNEELLDNSNNKLIYVTESIIDSLSLETIDPSIKTVALNGLPNYKRLLKVIEEKEYNGYLVLAFDNDKAGKTYQEIVEKELKKINISSFSITLISSFENENCKDLNEALMNNKEKLEKSYKYFNDNLTKYIGKNEGELEI